ncbi:FtsX-like permease family protein [Streptomyces sp. NPDC001404]|uniref:FtsX-like permease family protein n=1 Tax=Streptomyces sp. NPDC001404 TaxID=3364571 RepID=UPI0036758382
MGTLTTLLPVAVATLRKRWPGFVGSFVALALGTTLISAVGLLVGTTMGIDNPDPAAPSLKKLLTFMAGMSGFVSVFVVASTFAFAVAGRRRETALLRAVGATPRQVRMLVLGEAVVVSVVAAGCGGLLGLVVAPLMADWLVRRGVAPEGFTVRPAAGPLLVAAAVGIAVALLGAYAAARRAGRVRPVEALGDAAADRRVMTLGRWLWALGYLAFFVVVVALFVTMPEPLQRDPQLRDPQNMPVWSLLIDILAILAVALFTPLLVPPLVRLLTLPVPFASGAVGLLARQNALTAVRRTVSTATPVFLVVGLTGTVVGSTAAFGDARATQTRAALRAQYVVEPRGTSGLSDAALRHLRELPGARTTTLASTLVSDLGGGAVSGDAQDAATSSATVVDGDLATAWKVPTESGSLAALKGESVAVSADLAKANGWQVGDRLSAGLADGTMVTLRLVAVVRPPLSLSEVLLPYGPVAAHLDSRAPATAYVTTDPGVPAPVLPAGDRATVTDTARWGAVGNDPRSRYDWIAVLAILGPAVLYALLAIVNTMMMSTGDRLRDFATLRLTGGNDRQVLSMVGVEALLTVATATALALLVTAGTQLTTMALINHRILDDGSALSFRLPWTAIAGSAATGLVLALVSSLLPARLALRARALDLAGTRQ